MRQKLSVFYDTLQSWTYINFYWSATSLWSLNILFQEEWIYFHSHTTSKTSHISIITIMYAACYGSVYVISAWANSICGRTTNFPLEHFENSQIYHRLLSETCLCRQWQFVAGFKALVVWNCLYISFTWRGKQT